MSETIDLIVVGSGPSGVQAAKAAVEAGLNVVLVDFGNDSAEQERVPDRSFTELRRSDPEQRRYFLGSEFREEVERNDRLGAHFTAPRTFITKDSGNLLPVESDSFLPVQSLALGGLGAGWGAGTPTFEPFELERAGLPPEAMSRYYAAIADDVGISGAADDDTADQVLRIPQPQPPAHIDTNASAILRRYREKRELFRARRFTLGRAPLAMLTRPLDGDGFDRYANPYHDMDFYGTSRRSVYRPKYTVEQLSTKPKFRCLTGALVECFDEHPEGVVLRFVRAGMRTELRARKLLLAAGAINSARIAARSLGLHGQKFPILCNPMNYIACINLAMLGRAAADERHSLAQLLALYTPAHRHDEHVMAAIYSYRSLLHYRLVKDLPLPASLGLIVSRALMTSLTLVGVHHPERASEKKWMMLSENAGLNVLRASYELDDRERSAIRADLCGLKDCLRALGCIPVSVFSTEPGSSIHYAGTIPFRGTGSDVPMSCDSAGRLFGKRHTFVGDSSSWTYLPAKGLTLTLMANARRVADEVAADLRRSGTFSK